MDAGAAVARRFLANQRELRLAYELALEARAAAAGGRPNGLDGRAEADKPFVLARRMCSSSDQLIAVAPPDIGRPQASAIARALVAAAQCQFKVCRTALDLQRLIAPRTLAELGRRRQRPISTEKRRSGQWPAFNDND